MSIDIDRITNEEDAVACAEIMSTTSPWNVFGRDFAMCRALFLDPDRESWILRVNGVAAGFLVLVLQGAFVGYIQSLGLAEAFRNRGLGSQLMAFAEERIFRDHPNAFICASSFNPGAQRLYRRLGYEVVGELKNWVVAGHDEILMRKTKGPLLP